MRNVFIERIVFELLSAATVTDKKWEWFTDEIGLAGGYTANLCTLYLVLLPPKTSSVIGSIADEIDVAREAPIPEP